MSMLQVINIEDEIHCLKRELARAQNELQKAPAGNLNVEKRGKEYFYYYASHENGNERYGITTDKHMTACLARKAFLQKKIRLIEEDIKVLDGIDKRFKSIDDESVISSMHPRFSSLEMWMFLRGLSKKNNGLFTDKEWEDAPFETTDYMTCKRKFPINDGKGTKVRSKSEVIIASILMDLKVPFHYEEVLHLSDKKKVVPDFTIRRADGQIFYWEHFGMMDYQEYKNDHDIKLKTYDNYGIGPWNNLIVTYDSEDNPINPLEIEGIIKCKLM